MTSPDCRLSSAEDFARRAMKADAEFRDARNTLGQVLILETKYEEAIKVLEPLTKDPAYVANYLAWGNYGEALVALGRLDEGIAALRNSVTEPRFCTGHYRLGVAYEKKGDFVSAGEELLRTRSGSRAPTASRSRMRGSAWVGPAQARQDGGRAGDFARCREIGADDRNGQGVREARRRLCADAACAAPVGEAFERSRAASWTSRSPTQLPHRKRPPRRARRRRNEEHPKGNLGGDPGTHRHLPQKSA